MSDSSQVADPDRVGEESVEPEAKKRSLKDEIKRRVILLTIAFVVYVLGIGPLYWIYFDAKFNEGPTLVAAIYEPLYLLCDICRPFGHLVDAYVMLWIG